jgi:glutathione S-transferase
MLKLWGRASSSNVQKVVWALEEIGLAYERIDAGGPYGVVGTEAFAAMNPNRRVPVLQDGDLVLWESHAILRYICARHAEGSLWPADPVARAPADQWTDWTDSTFQPAWIALFVRAVRTPEDRRDPAAIARALERTIAAFEIMDAALANRPWLAGDALTYADLAAGVALYRWTTMDIERPPLPNVEAWHARLMDRPAFVKSVCISYAELVGLPSV